MIAGLGRFKSPMQKVLLLRGSLALCSLMLCSLMLFPHLLLLHLLFSFAAYSFALCPFYAKLMSLNYRLIQKMDAYHSSALGRESRPELRGRNLRSLSSILCPLDQSSPGDEARMSSLRSSALVKSRRGSLTTSHIIAREFCGPVHHFVRFRNNLLQQIRLFANYFTCDRIRKTQDALQPIGKAQQHLVVLVLFLQQLNRPQLSLLLIPIASTNLKCDGGDTEDGFCDWIELKGVNSLAGFFLGELTCANTAPYLILVSTILSVDPLRNGERCSPSFTSFSRSWSNERRESAYASTISWLASAALLRRDER